MDWCLDFEFAFQLFVLYWFQIIFVLCNGLMPLTNKIPQECHATMATEVIIETLFLFIFGHKDFNYAINFNTCSVICESHQHQEISCLLLSGTQKFCKVGNSKKCCYHHYSCIVVICLNRSQNQICFNSIFSETADTQSLTPDMVQSLRYINSNTPLSVPTICQSYCSCRFVIWKQKINTYFLCYSNAPGM